MSDEDDRYNAAREKFEEAIKELLEFEGRDGFLGDWFVIATQNLVINEDSTGTAYSTFINKHQTLHSTAGLLRYATAKIDRRLMFPEGDE